jgi:argininosuccinate lyase
MAGMVADWTVDAQAMRVRAEAGYLTATDLADWLVRIKAKPFRAAHRIAGAIVKRAEVLGVALEKVPLADMQAVDPAITADVFDVLTVAASVDSRQSFGGTAPARVHEQVQYWQEKLA